MTTTNSNNDNNETSIYNEDLSEGTFKVSLLHVMQSNAGFYIGRFCTETDEGSDDYMGGMEEPYSRESGYYPTWIAANDAMQAGFPVRDCIENNRMYGNGGLSLNGK